MAIKYRREGFRDATLGTPNRYDPRPPSRFKDPRQRLMVIYLGIGFVTILLLAYHFVSQSVATTWLPVRFEAGTVIEKGTSADEYYVIVEVAEGEALMRDRVIILESDWQLLQAGMVLGVEYRVTRDGSRMAVEELSFEDVDSP